MDLIEFLSDDIIENLKFLQMTNFGSLVKEKDFMK